MKRKRESGQAMVEFALILPILLLIVCGIIDFGWLFLISFRLTMRAVREQDTQRFIRLMRIVKL